MTNRPNGYLLAENAMYVVVATMTTENPKTGDMVQIWILPKDISPVDAVRTGQDDMVCFDCKHRGSSPKGRTCYVKVFQAPHAIWKAYNRGNYPFLPIEDYKYTFRGRKIRFGAYGEPVLIPLHIFRELALHSDGWTGYTHQWANPEYAKYGAYLMASVDSVAEYERARALGWRTFRVRTADGALMEREIVCPASDEANHRTTCADCRLCSGSYASDPRKDIAIVVHGSAAKKFIQIGA
jgi:hypothetical protein